MIKTKALVIAVSGVLAFYGNAAIATTNQDIDLPNSPTVNQQQVIEATPVPTGIVERKVETCVVYNGVKYCK